MPISQADALLTLMGGSVAPGIALHAIGYRTTTREIEAMMHFWRYVGHLLGVRPRWYPADVREGLQLAFVSFLKRAETAGDDGKRLCQSYADAFAPDGRGSLRERLAGVLEHGVHRGFTRLFLPPPLYRRFEMPPAGAWVLYPLALAPFVFAAETLRRRLPGVDEVADQVARRARRRWLTRQLGDRAAAFRPVQTFQR